jgi:branched-chain amino acid transport system permease protein
MEYLFQQLLNGLVIGSFLALMTVGFSMTYGVIRLANFAYGDIGYMMGAFLSLTFVNAGAPLLLAIPLGLLIAAAMGLLVVRVAYRPLFFAPRIVILLTTIGVSIFLENIAMVIWGAEMKPFPAAIFNGYITIGNVRIFFLQVLVILITVLLAAAMHYIIHYTYLGKTMRATAQDMDAARMMGIDVDRVVYVTFTLGTLLGGVAGLLSAVYYNAVYPMMGFIPTLKAFCIAVLGGIGSLPGALVGGVLMGLVEALGAGYINAGFRDGYSYLLLLVFLIILPAGLFGKKREAV